MRSIRGRLFLLAAVWLSAALLAAFLFISDLLEDFVTGRFDAETGAISDGLIAALQVDSSGRVGLESAPTDPRFTLPLSGWYWQIAADGQVMVRSDSLLDLRLNGPAGDYSGASGVNADQTALRVLRHEVTIPDSPALIAVTVTAPRDQINESLNQIIRPLGLALIALGIALVFATIVQVIVGLRSLDRLKSDLAQVRLGHADRLAMPEVRELRPLTAEINASLDQNAQLLARSRQHLGNLAHSLKTPLAAIANELPADHSAQILISRMDRLVNWHLRRARSAGPHHRGERTSIRSVVDDILLVLRWPIRDKNAGVSIICPDDAGFLGERQDLEEMIGNLAENAVKWCHARVLVDVSPRPGEITIRIEDDGPGMAETDTTQALLRGGRLDEHGLSGSGLGLAIVADLAALHGGELRLERSKMGGLAAILILRG